MVLGQMRRLVRNQGIFVGEYFVNKGVEEGESGTGRGASRAKEGSPKERRRGERYRGWCIVTVYR